VHFAEMGSQVVALSAIAVAVQQRDEGSPANANYLSSPGRPETDYFRFFALRIFLALALQRPYSCFCEAQDFCPQARP
jgi:hypothetical protein